jgi:hypothetical protein
MTRMETALRGHIRTSDADVRGYIDYVRGRAGD